MTATDQPTPRPARGRGRRRDESQSTSAVHDRIRAAILFGELEAGLSIPQHVLSDRFEAGRTPLREALRMLQREGLVVAEANYPVRIAELSADGFEQLNIQSLALEAVAVRITVPTLGSDDFAELEACMTKMDHYHAEGDVRGRRRPHRAFHRRLHAGAGPEVAAEINKLIDHSERYLLRFGQYGAWESRRAEHRAILDAAKAGDAVLAARCMGEHYARRCSLVFGVLDPDRDLTRLRVTLQTVAPGSEQALDED